jgi:hypothetical protein
MRTIFALFEGYREAKSAVEDLLEQGFDPREMNVVVPEPAARGNRDVDLGTAGVPKAQETGQDRLQGIDRMIAGMQPLTVSDVGAVYAAGEMARTAVHAVPPEEPPATGLKQALVNFDVPEELAEFYRNGVLDEGVLFWMRTEDRRAAEAANILAETKGKKTAGT